jgi:hypothetical protein
MERGGRRGGVLQVQVQFVGVLWTVWVRAGEVAVPGRM